MQENGLGSGFDLRLCESLNLSQGPNSNLAAVTRMDGPLSFQLACNPGGSHAAPRPANIATTDHVALTNCMSLHSTSSFVAHIQVPQIVRLSTAEALTSAKIDIENRTVKQKALRCFLMKFLDRSSGRTGRSRE
jgi:hypothetical protein